MARAESLMIGRLSRLPLMLVAILLAASAAAAASTARTEAGAVVGVEQGPAAVYRAIPYAAPPLGPLRWKPPRPARRWRGERLAASAGPACPQGILPSG